MRNFQLFGIVLWYFVCIIVFVKWHQFLLFIYHYSSILLCGWRNSLDKGYK